jgi:hypothetical protein
VHGKVFPFTLSPAVQVIATGTRALDPGLAMIGSGVAIVTPPAASAYAQTRNDRVLAEAA